jgi:hypothetical protein
MHFSGEQCSSCNCFRSAGVCDVANGAEDINYCEGVHDYLRRQYTQRHPISEDEHYQIICLELEYER